MDVYGTWVAHIVTALVLWHIVALFGSHGSASLVRRTQGGAGLGTPLAGETCESTISWAPGDAWSGPMWKLIAKVGLQVGLKRSKFPQSRFDLVQMPQLATCVWTRHEHTQPVACASLILHRLQTAWVWLMIFNGRCAK